MKNFINYLVVALITVFTVSSCSPWHRVRPSAGEEAVITHKPMFFGSDGVDMQPVNTGSKWIWFSDDATMVSMVPTKYSQVIDDASSNDNTLLDFNTSITLKVEDGKSPVLIKNYGSGWYSNVIKEQYINCIYNYVSQYSPFDLISNREVLDEINKNVERDMKNHIASLSKHKELPVNVVSVLIGKAMPNKMQKEEMERTAAATQAKQTQERRKEMEEAREAAERQRAMADKAYQKELGLTTDQFIQLRAWEIIAAKNGANIDVMFNADNTNKMWNIRR